MKLLPVLTVLATISLAAGAQARDRSAPFEELAKAIEALKAAGCTALQSLDAEEPGFEAEGVICGGSTYSIKLDRDFNIVSKRKDGS